MGTRIEPYTSELVPAVAAFNRRMAEAKTGWGWYEEATDSWLPRREDVEIWREHYLALDDEGAVHGAYALKPQPWWIQGERVTVCDWQGPVSEGVIDPRHSTLGLRLIRDMVKRFPNVYSWGHGGDDAAMLQLIRKLGWLIHDTPFCLRVCHPYRFLRLNAYLRASPRNRALLDALALSGGGSLGFRAYHAARGIGRPNSRDVTAEPVDRFGAWADEIWETCHPAYAAIALRDAATMNALVPTKGWPGGIRLRVRRSGRDIGWAVVLDNQLAGDARFGDLRVGCIADVLALPDDAPSIVRAATRFLQQRGVDMIGSNQAHPRWAEAFAGDGYLVLPNRRTMAISPAFQEALEPFERVSAGLHVTNMDGHGPHGF